MDERVTHIKDRLARPSGGVNMDLVIIVIFAVDFLVVFALVAVLSPSQALWVVPLVIASPFAIFALLNVLMWKPLERRFPAAPQSRDAVVKLGQSVLFGKFFRFNNALALAADEDHLHLIPFMPMRWTGAKVVSIPWERVTEVAPAPARFSMKLTKAKVNGRTLGAPEWAMKFARVEVDETGSTIDEVG